MLRSVARLASKKLASSALPASSAIKPSISSSPSSPASSALPSPHLSHLLQISAGIDPDTNSRIEALILEHSLLSAHHRANHPDNLVRCTVFDPQGNVRVVSGEFRRSELLSRHGLLPRDLRKLDIGVASIVPSILVRHNSILVNLLHIRALIKADLVLIFDAYGSTDSQTQSIFMYDLSHKLRGNDDLNSAGSANQKLPYELRALEAIFVSVVSALDAEMRVLSTVVNGILSELEVNIDRGKLRHLLIQSKKLTAFLQKATLIRDAIDELLEQDEDLAGLYLTAKKNGEPAPEDYSEVEMLLESYYKHCDEIVQTVDNLVSNIRSTEEIINIILDSNRNSLMLLDLKFQIGTLGLGAGAFVSALYGMNLQNFIEETNWGFGGVTGIVSIATVAVIMMSLRTLQKVQRITMMSKSKQNNKGGNSLGGSLFKRPVLQRSKESTDTSEISILRQYLHTEKEKVKKMNLRT